MLIHVTLPVFNEERRLAASARKVRLALEQIGIPYELVIANNGSTDRTTEIAKELDRLYPTVHRLRLVHPGRGAALKAAWFRSRADIMSYMDVDLSADLDCLAPLIEPLMTGRYDLVIGSRLLNPETTTRGWRREFISRGYNRLLRIVLGAGFTDAQCGFKAITRRAARKLLPLVENANWFFDTELLVLAQRLGWRIFDLPVRWKEDEDSRVKVFGAMMEDLRGVIRLRRAFATGKYDQLRNGSAR